MRDLNYNEENISHVRQIECVRTNVRDVRESASLKIRTFSRWNAMLKLRIECQIECLSCKIDCQCACQIKCQNWNVQKSASEIWQNEFKFHVRKDAKRCNSICFFLTFNLAYKLADLVTFYLAVFADKQVLHKLFSLTKILTWHIDLTFLLVCMLIWHFFWCALWHWVYLNGFQGGKV